MTFHYSGCIKTATKSYSNLQVACQYNESWLLALQEYAALWLVNLFVKMLIGQFPMLTGEVQICIENMYRYCTK